MALFLAHWSVSGAVASESALRCAGTPLSQVGAPPKASWPDAGPESLRSPCCGLAINFGVQFSYTLRAKPEAISC
ncbi:hypothetical protein PoB_007400000 [Plakobranchus ocellatus]|uniref:Secreted protein n=1 Tax=Plakobranchus ocellatus TaxID=259542 RepID=A0AAV4DU50_9GAST|nr:hypothetical protein PoB_007400000 [Plakobranchus ocellatus]